MTRPSIDVLLAVYNGERFLRPFLDSLAVQSCRDFRLVVSNNRSSDSTAEILEEYRKQSKFPILVLPSPEWHISAQDNFARVTGSADAAYVMYADADDVWHPDKVDKTLVAMKSAERLHGTQEPILVHSDLRVVDENLRCVHPSFWRYQFIDPRRTGLHQLVLQNCVTGCTVMLNRALIELGRPIPPEACVHDHWFALVASAFGQIIIVREPLIEYRQHAGNVTGAKEWGARYIVESAWRLFGENGARETITRNVAQAQAFLSRFERRLDPAQRQVVRNFATITEQGTLGRRWSLIRNRHWKAGFARNLGLLLAI